LFEWIYQGYKVPVFGGGLNRYQFVHAGDLAEACILASKRKGPETYNRGTDRFGTMREALECLCRSSGTGAQVRSLPTTPMVIGTRLCSALHISPLGAYHALMYGQSMYFDISKARNHLGWRPRYSNDEMLIESYEWYVKSRPKILGARRGKSHHQTAVKQGALGALRSECHSA
jgi:nucleoside-diphosphate-sugar epimerase